MMKHRSVLDPTHPERPERISRIHDMMADYGLLDRCLKLKSRKATNQELCTVHRCVNYTIIAHRVINVRKSEYVTSLILAESCNGVV